MSTVRYVTRTMSTTICNNMWRDAETDKLLPNFSDHHSVELINPANGLYRVLDNN